MQVADDAAVRQDDDDEGDDVHEDHAHEEVQELLNENNSLLQRSK
jgi:hypothetical protein